MGEKERMGVGKKIFLTIIVIFGLTLLWFGSCFTIGLFAFSLGSASMILVPLAFILPTILVVWLFVKFIRGLNKKSPLGSQQTLQ
jgi:membrane protein implicated in regulation of membrane protease activity